MNKETGSVILFGALTLLFSIVLYKIEPSNPRILDDARNGAISLSFCGILALSVGFYQAIKK